MKRALLFLVAGWHVTHAPSPPNTTGHRSLREGEARIWRERIKVDIKKCGDVEGKEQEQEERATGGSLQASCAALGGRGSV